MSIGITINTSEMTLAELLTTTFHGWHGFVITVITLLQLIYRTNWRRCWQGIGKIKEGTSHPVIKTSSNCNKTTLVHVMQMDKQPVCLALFSSKEREGQ